METISFRDLKDKVCIITGGAGIIGTALIRGLASVGVRCAILDIDRDTAEKTAREIRENYSVQTVGIHADVLNRESLDGAREAVHDALGQVDLLINGAGGNSPLATTQVERLEPEYLTELDKTFFGLNIEGFDRVFNLNFKGTLLPTMVFSKDMLEKRKGVILNISSMNSLKPLTKIPAYSAAKASINNFTEWLAVHLAPVGIRVNAIAPGFFLTQQNRFLLVDERTGEPTPRGRKIIANTPMGRYGQTEELQGTALYLLSDVSQFVTGIIIPVDGGYNAFGGI